MSNLEKQQRPKRGRGRPPLVPGEKRVHVDLMLSPHVARALGMMPSGERSSFVDEVLAKNPRIFGLLQVSEQS